MIRAVIALAAVGVALVILGINVWAWLVYGPDETVSANIQRWAHLWPVIAVVAGLLIGHLFKADGIRPWVLMGMAIAWLVW